jgi:cyanophycin synthetase
MMLIEAEVSERSDRLRLAPNFRSWQRNTVVSGLLPVIAIGGTRGKSIVVRMLDEIYRAAHLRTATWTNQGIEVRGRRQQGELAAWSTTLSRIAAGTIDVAIQELHWSTVNAVGLPPSSYPVVGIINLWPDEEDHREHIRLATVGTERMAVATNESGLFVAAGEDYRLMDIAHEVNPNTMITARSRELPALHAHLEENGSSLWVEKDVIYIGDGDQKIELMPTREIVSSLGGHALFQLTNAMTAAGIAYATGIAIDTIRESLRNYSTSVDTLPASFNVFDSAPYITVVNRIESPGITRSIIRAANPRGRKRQISVFGDLGSMTTEECLDLGRMAGRYHGAVLLHSQSDDALVEQFRRGIASNEYPPLIIHVATERRALNRAFQTAQPEDVMLIFTSDDGRAATRAVMRQLGDPTASADGE